MVLLITTTMVGVGMGLIRFANELDEQGLGLVGFFAYSHLGLILILASPGVLIGYGYNRLRGAILGGISSIFLIYLPLIILALLLS